MKYFFIILILFISPEIQAQYDTIYLAIKPFTTSHQLGERFANTAQLHAQSLVDQDYRILRVDRDIANAVKWEKEFQKSEDFIDGEIVEQGKAIGASYVLEGHYNYKSKKLKLRIFDVNMERLKCALTAKKKNNTRAIIRANPKLNSNETPIELSASEIRSNIQELLDQCFPNNGWAVLRAVDENDKKVKKLLIAAGNRMGMRRKTTLELIALRTEEVDGQQLERMEVIGTGKIEKVEDGNFSILKVDDGAKAIKKLLAEGVQLRCRKLKR